MFFFNCLLTTICLGVTSIIQHALAAIEPQVVSTCIELIKQGNYFVGDEDGGPDNFIKAFKDLSVKQIDDNFKAPVNVFETIRTKHKRELQHYLTKSYFMNLFANHGLDLSSLMTPSQWCEDKCTEEDFDPEIYENDEDWIIECLEFTISLLKNDEQQDKPELIFQTFYEDWSYKELEKISPSILNRHYFTTLREREIFEKRLKYNITTYIDPYFKHYVDVLSNIESRRENFQSIQQYCEFIGHIFVTGSTTNDMLQLIQILMINLSII